MEATKAEDAPENPDRNFAAMDPERRQFLENVLKALTIDVVEELQKAVQVLASDTATEDEQLEALETIMEYVIDIDTAIDFCKIGGLTNLLPCLNSPYSKVRATSASLIAELAQNNPYCQKALLDADVLPKLIALLNESETATNGIHAISCLVRSYEPTLAAFIDVGGLECIIGCLQQIDQQKLIIRALFLLNSLCADFPDVREEFIKLKVVEHIIELLKPVDEYDISVETALSVLCMLTESSEAISRCQTSELSLKPTIDSIVELAGDKPECREIVEYAQLLLRKVFNSTETTTDR